MTAPFAIRRATSAAGDVDAIARHRAGMFRDMGSVSAAAIPTLIAFSRERLSEALTSGEYVGWVASPVDDKTTIVAGAGVLIRRGLPFPQGRDKIALGRQALVMNVFTEPEHRRRGAARLLMLQVMAWARDAGIESLVLHAAPEGRQLYESLGFVATNEMRYDGDIATWTRPVQ